MKLINCLSFFLLTGFRAGLVGGGFLFFFATDVNLIFTSEPLANKTQIIFVEVETMTEQPNEGGGLTKEEEIVITAEQAQLSIERVEEAISRPADEDEDEDEDDSTMLHWKRSMFAVGRVNVLWSDEVRRDGSEVSERPGFADCHLKISGLVCSALKAERVGNMSVLRMTTGDPPELLWVAGPLWFVTLFVTVPLIVGISLAIYLLYLRCLDIIWVPIVWAIALALLLFSLFMTSLSDPGMLLRHTEPKEDDWVWNDQALTFRSPNSKYDPVCAAVIEGFGTFRLAS